MTLMDSADIAIREAREADWEAIWPFFSEIVREQETYSYDPAWTAGEAQRVWLPGTPMRTVVLEERGQILGSAVMGPNRPGPGSHVGTGAFMVSPSARGRRVGRRLGEHVIQWHRSNGFLGIQFNAVVQSNTAAVRLWQSLGFQIIGTVPGAFQSPTHGYVGLHVMFLDLTE